MAATFLTYRKFNDIELAKTIAERLEQGNIDYLLEDNHHIFDPSFANNTIEPDISIKLQSEDFLKADKVLEDFYSKSLDAVDNDYYMLDFTDEELMEVVLKPDEWGPFDYKLAQKLLKERGKEVNSELADLLKRQRIKELSKPDHVHKYWIYAGYICAFLGGLIGLIIGWTLGYFKKTLPDGQRVYAFGEKDRNHGKNILLIASASIIVCSIINWIYGLVDIMK